MLRSVELENFLSHSRTRLELDKGVTVFVGPNGAGKSSIIDAITFALFGEHIRKSTKSLLRRGSNQAYAKVDFTIGNKQYQAVRKIDARGTVAAQLYEKVNNETAPLAAGERRQFGESMTKIIESLAGLDFEKLKVASIVQQGELQAIIEADPKKFKELVNAIIGIDRLDTAYELMKKTIDVFRESVRSRLGYDDTSIEILQNGLDLLAKEISSLEPQQKKLEKEKATQEQEFVTLQKKIEIEVPKELKIKEMENKRDELARHLKRAITSIKSEITEKERRLADCSNSLLVLSSKSQVEIEVEGVEKELDRIRKESKETGENIAKIMGQQEIASKLRIVDGRCPVCNTSVSHLNPLFEEEHLREELETLKKKTWTFSHYETSLQKKKKDLDLKRRQIIKAESILLTNRIETQDDLLRLRDEIVKLQTSVKEIPQDVSTTGNLLQFAIDEYSTDTIKIIKKLSEETSDFDIVNFQNLKSRLEQQRRLLSALDQEMGAVDAKLKLHKGESEKISKVLKELDEVRLYLVQLELIRGQIYNRDGPVATSLRSWTLDMISQKASEYLRTFNVKIQRVTLEDKTKDLGITCYSGNSTLDLESLSGGEKVSVALALRLGMAHVIGLSHLSFIILDEPTTHLDQERRKSLVSVLSQAFESNIDSISQFIIITHDAEIFENSGIDAMYDFKSTPEGTLVTSI